MRRGEEDDPHNKLRCGTIENRCLQILHPLSRLPSPEPSARVQLLRCTTRCTERRDVTHRCGCACGCACVLIADYCLIFQMIGFTVVSIISSVLAAIGFFVFIYVSVHEHKYPLYQEYQSNNNEVLSINKSEVVPHVRKDMATHNE